MSLKRTIPSFLMKKDYVMLGVVSGSYRRLNDVQNEGVEMLRLLFVEDVLRVDSILRVLMDPTSRGITGEYVGISAAGQKAFIEPAYLTEDYYPEDFCIEIERDELIRLSHEWQELIDNKVAPIYIYYKDGKYGVADMLPDDMITTSIHAISTEKSSRYVEDDILSKKPEIKENYAILRKAGKCYVPAGYAKNGFVDTLQFMFICYYRDIGFLTLALMDPEKETPMPEGKFNIILEGENALVQRKSLQKNHSGKNCRFFEANRHTLGHLLHKWITFAQEDAELIYIFHKDGRYHVSDIFPGNIK